MFNHYFSRRFTGDTSALPSRRGPRRTADHHEALIRFGQPLHADGRALVAPGGGALGVAGVAVAPGTLICGE